MILRKLLQKDAPGIYEWMNDKDINCFFRFEKESATMNNITRFIDTAQDTNENLHLAVVNDDDEYLGTVSLKSINHTAKNAEYAISMRKCAQGSGAALYASREILKIGFEQMGLHRIYLNVLTENGRANHFYQKFGFLFEGEFKDHILIHGELKSLKWYRLLKEEFEDLGKH